MVNDFLNKMPIAIVIKENTGKFMYDKLSFNQRQQRRSAKKQQQNTRYLNEGLESI